MFKLILKTPIITILALTFLGVIVLGACAPTDPKPDSDDITATSPTTPTEDTTTPDTAENPEDIAWVTELNLSGGFAGVQKSIEISSTGEVIILDEKINERIEMELPQADLEIISQLVENILNLPKISEPEPSTCADCFLYVVDIMAEELHVHATFDDLNLIESDFEPLIGELSRLLNDAFAQ